jgi:hypothetical protein
LLDQASLVLIFALLPTYQDHPHTAASCWGFQRQPCGEESVSGPVIGQTGVSCSAFVLFDSSIYGLRRLFTTISPDAKRFFI